VFLHTDRAGDHPSCSPQNAFGDLNEGELCPANPDARAYVRALAADVSRYEVQTILAESLHYHPLEHGYHHERYFVSLDSLTRFLLGLCFCEHCVAAARRQGVDAARVHGVVRAELDQALAEDEESGTTDPPTRATLAGIADGELLGYLDARADTISSLVAEAAEAVEARGRRLVFLDPAGAFKGYATGRPQGGPAAEISWLYGMELAKLARSCHGIEAIGDVADPARLELEIEAYRAALGPETPVAVCLRPTPPDCENSANLTEKVSVARSLGVTRMDFYHYGFLRLSALDWIRTALAE
jgi:AcrR family transcriptional regulator